LHHNIWHQNICAMRRASHPLLLVVALFMLASWHSGARASVTIGARDVADASDDGWAPADGPTPEDGESSLRQDVGQHDAVRDVLQRLSFRLAIKFHRSSLKSALDSLLVAFSPVDPIAREDGRERPVRSTPGQARDRLFAQGALGQRICPVLERSAFDYDLPLEFFTHLIWQESRFNPRSVSHAGAQGIAQFMPGTARMRGLDDPFDPSKAIPKSAELLGDLKSRFGNLGLAAAAYNAGPRRVTDWLAGRGGLPRETLAYVRIVTGRPAADWRAPDAAAMTAETTLAPCEELARLASRENAGGRARIAARRSAARGTQIAARPPVRAPHALHGRALPGNARQRLVNHAKPGRRVDDARTPTRMTV
jgi:hypothetical protein